MPGLEYQHIGHDPRRDAIAIWSIDDRGELREDRTPQSEPPADWAGRSHERLFPEVKMKALGRVELHRRAGSIHISDPGVVLSTHRFSRLLDTLDERYPRTRWYVFGSGFTGQPVMAALAERVIG